MSRRRLSCVHPPHVLRESPHYLLHHAHAFIFNNANGVSDDLLARIDGGEVLLAIVLAFLSRRVVKKSGVGFMRGKLWLPHRLPKKRGLNGRGLESG